MNIGSLVSKVSEEAGLSKTATRKVLTSVLAAIGESLKKGDGVRFAGFGTFYATQRKARVGRNPQTGETLKIPAARVPRFRPGKTLRDSVKSPARKSARKKA